MSFLKVVKMQYFLSFFSTGDAKVVPSELHVRGTDRQEDHRSHRRGPREASDGAIRNPALQKNT